jgi:peptidoglycan glycosyltransferase
MKQFAEIFGFNKTFYIDGIKAAQSSFDVKDARSIDFGWSSIGQYTNQMNPLQYLCSVSAVANGGKYVEPHFLKAVTTNSGRKVYSANPSVKKILPKETADKLAELMDYAVSNNYGKGSFGSLDVCGKTGTAEVGEKKENSLFVGFCKDSDLPLAFVVVVEDGGSGSGSAMLVANRVLQAAKQSLE